MRLEDAIRDRMERDPEFARIWQDREPQRAFQQALVDARMRAGLTQHQLADASGIGRATIARLELAEQNPTVDTLQKLSLALGVTFSVDAAGVTLEPAQLSAD